MEHPDPGKHQMISFAKSAVRIVASIATFFTIATPTTALLVLAAGYGIAEVIGILEEMV
jgi:hypothetical protein